MTLEEALKKYIRHQEIEWNVAIPGHSFLVADAIIPHTLLGRPVVICTDMKRCKAMQAVVVQRFQSHFVFIHKCHRHDMHYYVLMMLERLLKASPREIVAIEYSNVRVKKVN